MTYSKEAQAFNQGKRSKSHTNPYLKGTLEHKHWNTGHEDAPTLVMFRWCRWPCGDGKRVSYEVLAVFPLNTERSPDNVTVYAHIGQHGVGSFNRIMEVSRPATQEVYADLKVELEKAIGYKLQVIQRRSKAMFEIAYSDQVHLRRIRKGEKR